MNVRQGFNRIGVSVAIAFVALAAISLSIAGINYLEYRDEVAVEYGKRFGEASGPDRDRAIIAEPGQSRRNWDTFRANRYRSVQQALDLAVMCIVAGAIALIFWAVVGWLSVVISPTE